MTRAESYEIRGELWHKDYMNRRGQRLAYAKQYYQDHREKIRDQQRERRKRKAAGESTGRELIFDRPSTESFENECPYMLRMNLTRLREKFLAIPIHERPTYDYFLRCETIEHYRKKLYERRETISRAAAGGRNAEEA